jgi:hypothetical protein
MTQPLSMDDLDARMLKALSNGFHHADEMFSRLLERKVLHNGYYFDLQALSGLNKGKSNLMMNKKNSLLITTNIFGMANGKSYLLLSELEMNNIVNIKGLEDASSEMKISFVKELANILSASVITVISNEFNIKVFGDIPILHTSPIKIEDVIREDFNDAQSVFILGTHLKSETVPKLKMVFIWAR